VARCETDVVYGAETCVRVGACTRSQRGRRDSLCPRAVVLEWAVSSHRMAALVAGQERRLTTRRTHAIESPARGRLLLRRLEPEAAGASRGRFVAVPRRPFHNSELGSARRSSSPGSISRGRLLRCASSDGGVAIRQTTASSRSASRRSGVVPSAHRQCRRSSTASTTCGSPFRWRRAASSSGSPCVLAEAREAVLGRW
jgi:hypothetical protein